MKKEIEIRQQGIGEFKGRMRMRNFNLLQGFRFCHSRIEQKKIWLHSTTGTNKAAVTDLPTLAVTDLPTLDNRSFWPRPAYVRRWKFPPKQGANLDPEKMERAEPPKDTDRESGKPEESAGTPGVTTNL